jgi:hypothetical protein
VASHWVKDFCVYFQFGRVVKRTLQGQSLGGESLPRLISRRHMFSASRILGFVLVVTTTNVIYC